MLVNTLGELLKFSIRFYRCKITLKLQLMVKIPINGVYGAPDILSGILCESQLLIPTSVRKIDGKQFLLR